MELILEPTQQQQLPATMNILFTLSFAYTGRSLAFGQNTSAGRKYPQLGELQHNVFLIWQLGYQQRHWP